MSDQFREVIFNDGEALAYADFIDAQRNGLARLFDQVLRHQFGSPTGSADPELRTSVLAGGTGSRGPWIYALRGGAGYIVPGAGSRQVTIRGGTVFQPADAGTAGALPLFVPYTFADAEFTLTLAAGDATMPRVDIIECKLDWADDAAVSRDFSNVGLTAATGTDDTILVVGDVGILPERASTVYAVYAITGTVGGVKEIIPPSLTPMSGQVALGTDLQTLTFAATDGVIQAKVLYLQAPKVTLSTQTMVKSRRVNAVVQVKQGTPGSPPAYPTLTSGFGALGAVYVPAAHNAVFTATHMRDPRIPLGIRVVDVPAHQIHVDQMAPWTLSNNQGSRLYAAAAARGDCHVYQPISSQASRLVAVGLSGALPNDGSRLLKLWRYRVSTVLSTGELADLATTLSGTTEGYRQVTQAQLATASTYFQRGTPSADGIGDAFWGNGELAGPATEFVANNALPSTSSRLVLSFNGSSGAEVHFARFFFAG